MLASILALGALASSVSANGMQFFGGMEKRQTSDAITCATGLYLMLGPGCHLPCINHGPDLLVTLQTSLLNAYPGSETYIVPYDNSTKQAQVSTILMVQQANNYIQACPNSPVVFLGYSLGGIVVMNTLCGGISPSYASNVIAAVNYGEETFVGGLSYDKGTCQNSAPLYARGNTAACAPFAPAIQEYCDSTDPQCCAGGNNSAAHFTYPGLYDNDAFQFISQKYAQWNATHASTSSSVASSTAAPTSSSTSAAASTTSSAPFGNTSASSTTTSTTTVEVVSTVSATSSVASVSGAELMTITFTLSGSVITATAAVPTYYPSIPLSAAVEQSTDYPSSLLSAYSSGASSYSAAVSSAIASASSAASASATASGSAPATATGGAATSSGVVVPPASSAAGSSGSAATGSAATGTAATSKPASATSSGASPTISPYKGAASAMTMPASGAFRFIAKALKTVAACLLI